MGNLNTARAFFVNTNRNTPTAGALWHSIQGHLKPDSRMMALASRKLSEAGAPTRGPATVFVGPGTLSPTQLQAYYAMHRSTVVAPSHTPLFGVDWMGYGYRPFGLEMQWDYVSSGPLFQFPEFVDYQYQGNTYSIPTVVGVQASSGRCAVDKIDESSVEDTLHSFYDRFVAGGGWGLFKGEMDVAYSKAVERHWEYRTAAIRCEMALLRMAFTSLDSMASLLVPEAKDDLAKVTSGGMDPTSFFDEWGTHYISGIYIGGRYTLYMSFKKNSYKTTTEIDVKVGATMLGISTSNQTKINDALSTLDTRDEVHITGYGGLSIPLDWSGLGVNEWQAAVKADPGPMGFSGFSADALQGLTPIYTLVSDPTKRDALKRAFQNYCKQHMLQLPDIGPALTYLRVGCDNNKRIAMNQARANGFTLVDVDLNQGAGGAWIYLGKRIENIAADGWVKPIIDLTAVTGSANVGAPAGYTRYPVDMNKGAGGAFIYLCSTRDPTRQPLKLPIRDITVESFDSARNRESFTLRDLEPVTEPGVDTPLDFNRGSGGKFIYVLMRRWAAR